MVDDTVRHTTQLLRIHGPALVLYAQQWCLSPEDVVQDSFLKLLQQRPYPDQPVAWLYRVVRNGSLNASRSANRRSRHEGAAAGQSPPWFAPSPEARLDAAAAQQALQMLPIELRETIVARLWGGLSFEAIADVTGTSVSTAHRRYVQGLQSLRSTLGAPCPTTKTPTIKTPTCHSTTANTNSTDAPR